jgi:Xaa-Pro aminopeptidase
VGLAVHEGPGLRTESKTILEAGMTVTIEPGIYVPGVGGCRVEDLVVLTEAGAESLSQAPYQEPGHQHPLEAWA